MAIRVIITGSTGYVGEGVLLECLSNPNVSEVLMVNRRHNEIQHQKLKELLVPDYFQLDNYSNEISGYDACFFCAGISSIGMNEADYNKITYETTLTFANSLLKVNKEFSFCYVSGSHTDSTEKGKVMWARVKGKTENALIKLPFKSVFNFRPGGMIATKGQKYAKTGIKIVVGILKLFLPKSITKVSDVGKAMINAVMNGYPKQIIEVGDIKNLAGIN